MENLKPKSVPKFHMEILFSGGTIKSYSKRKLSTDDKINDVDLDDDGLSESKTTVTIQLDPHQQNNPQLFQVIFLSH